MPVASKQKRTTMWILIGLLSLEFFAFGAPKLLGTQMTKDEFETWGYPDWFRLVVGMGEVAAAILLWVPVLRFWVATGLVLEMVGAIVTHIRVAEYAILPLPIVTLVLAAALAWVTLPSFSKNPKDVPTS